MSGCVDAYVSRALKAPLYLKDPLYEISAMKLSEYWPYKCKRPFVLFGLGLVMSGAIAACSSSLPNSYEANVADHLTASGAKMYGAYWCPHCATQKDYFGGAVSRIPYIECDPEGINSQAALCRDMGITAYPTWIIEGEYYLGAQPLAKLGRLSGFEGAIAKEGDAEPAGEVSPAY